MRLPANAEWTFCDNVKWCIFLSAVEKNRELNFDVYEKS